MLRILAFDLSDILNIVQSASLTVPVYLSGFFYLLI